MKKRIRVKFHKVYIPKAYADRGFTRWGIFTNLFDAEDRKIIGSWYFHVHTPWTILEIHPTIHY